MDSYEGLGDTSRRGGGESGACKVLGEVKYRQRAGRVTFLRLSGLCHSASVGRWRGRAVFLLVSWAGRDRSGAPKVVRLLLPPPRPRACCGRHGVGEANQGKARRSKARRSKARRGAAAQRQS